MAARQSTWVMPLHLPPALPTDDGDDWLSLPEPPRVPPSTAAPRKDAGQSRRRGRRASPDFLAGLVGGATFVLTSTLVLAVHFAG